MKKIDISLISLSFVISVEVAAEDIRPGLWKISLESGVAATPDWKPQPFELTQCLSANDARNPDQLLAGAGAQGVSSCEFLNRQFSGDHLSFDLNCPGSLGMTGHGELTFSATALDGRLNVNFGGKDAVAMQNVLHAVYLGDCAESGAGVSAVSPLSTGTAGP